MIAKGQGGMWETRHLKEGTNQGQGYLLFGSNSAATWHRLVVHWALE
jgi:hypothetical protein